MIDFKRVLRNLTPEQQERVAQYHAEQKAIDDRTVQIRAIRTNAHSGQVSIVMVGIYPKDGLLQMVGGPTGYESMAIDRLDRAIEAGGWLACFGTEQRWDKLVVPRAELEKVRKHLTALGHP